MAEEHRFQAPRLCANNCGFFGSPATQNLCSKCFRDLQLKQQNSSNAKHALNQTLASASTAASSSAAAASSSAAASLPYVLAVDAKEVAGVEVGQSKAEPTAVAQPSRCSTCWRRVGLTGFRCRCGYVYCGAHRYPEQHHCSFDFKGLGKEQIAKANPVVKAEKLEKI